MMDRENEQSQKTIAIFAGYFLPHLGGVERYVDKLSEALIRLNYRVIVVSSNDGNHPSVEKDDNRTIYRLPIHNIFKNRYPIPKINSEYREIHDLIRRENIDCILVNTRFHLTSLVGARLGAKKKVPVLLLEHGTDHFTIGISVLDFFGKIYEHILTTYLKRMIAAYYGVSLNCNKWLKHFRINASGVFYNAIDTNYEPKAENLFDEKYPADETVIVYAGRLIKEKGVLNLIDAYRSIQDAGINNTRLVIAGDGPLYNQIKSKYGDGGIDVVGRLGYEDVMSLYRRANIFIYPSLYPEGLPTSILEAGLMRCAIIATPRGGTEEVIVDSGHGTIIDGTVESIKSALFDFINDDNRRNVCVQNVYNRVKTVFNWDATAKQVDIAVKNQRGK